MNGRRCHLCGAGEVVPTSMPGRTMTYMDRRLPIPATLPVPTCTWCREQWIDASTAEALDEALGKFQRCVADEPQCLWWTDSPTGLCESHGGAETLPDSCPRRP